MTIVLRLLLIFAICGVDSAFAADSRSLAVQQAEESGAKVALVIGNSAYRTSPLKNPGNDARAMAAKLSALGFDVILRENLGVAQVGGALREFRAKLKPGSVAIFFYAGHGLQVKGVNYLPTVDAEIAGEEDVPRASLNVNEVLALMDEAKTRLNLVFLDACRDNPFARSFRSAAGGLAKVEAPSGTLISFATRPGSVAADGKGNNGLYTENLLAAMDQPGLSIEQVLKRVIGGVRQASNGQQEPWMEGSIEGEFSFHPGQAAQVASLVPSMTSARSAAQIEDELWDTIKDSDKASVFEEYIRQYPRGRYLAQARVTWARLKTGARATPTAVPAKGDDADTALWKAVTQGNGADDYDVYLKQYPKGKYSALAKQRLQKLKDEARQEADAAEQSTWQSAESAPTVEAYGAYLTSYPNGRYAALAQTRIGKLKREAAGQDAVRQQREKLAAAQREDEQWKQLINSEDGSVPANGATGAVTVQSFLEQHPNRLESIKALARKGDAESQANLARMYARGWGVTPDDQEALTWARQSAEQGNASAQNVLGFMYAAGRGVPKDDAEAVKWFRKSAEQGNALGQTNLGVRYANGLGVSKDAEEAFKWHRKSAEQGHALSQYLVGIAYFYGQSASKNETEAVTWFRKAAEQGNAAAQTNLGVLYDRGNGVSQDTAEAVKWHRKSAEQGNALGQNNLGAMYQNGRGVSKDEVEAIKWFRKSAEQGDANGQNNMGIMYGHGYGVPRDEAEAVRWYRKSAEQGNALAQFNLGTMYDGGHGVSMDMAEALKWYRKSADQGYAAGQYNLGVMYDKGKGVSQDTAEAVRWFRKSADQGYASGQFNVGVNYLYGKGGLPLDRQEAMRLFRLAAAQGDAAAQSALRKLGEN